jgi:hypothetical protein
VPWHSPTFAPRAVPLPPKALVLAPPKPVLVPPPNGEDVVADAPNAGFAAPKSPPPVLVLAPKPVDAAVFVEPKPPKPEVVFDVPVLPNKPPPVAGAAAPKAGLAAPKPVFCVAPKPGLQSWISFSQK